ncbi:Dynein heavy chain 7, axonemal [Monoraphidium neglectum]|uniref:Dynein heavy chain 7, axonemal n=1 Tax=Monoraphidium neglectum TaxID=145388 RepID=A0A0D2LXR9_9CHLO|nr:Dynein heavy chain 7, axonemal [Monoraphidium neglectum]KIY94301.1 Dynein heavy chain 7, axonemal [Monoraphidium neglectum]|eukprot:XP_013893321.1 Dynein heavy chain 7, axonemal [Monoraphidium neglectum]
MGITTHQNIQPAQGGVKITNDPPKGLRANLLGSYLSDPVSDPAFFDGCARPGEFKKLLFGLCFFHAFVQERLKFGPLGWNVPYQFSAPDFAISARQLLMMVNEAPPDALPLTALRYLTGECNYGGRVTDEHDRRSLAAALGLFYCRDALEEGYRFSGSPLYFAPPEGPHESYTALIKALPSAAPPEVFGLHANADITRDRQEVQQLLDSLLATQGSGGGGGSSSSTAAPATSNSGSGSGGPTAAALSRGRDEVLSDLVADVSRRLARPFDIEAARYKYPVDYYESMNSVLCQELVRFNRLLEPTRSSSSSSSSRGSSGSCSSCRSVIHSSLAQLAAALRGEALLSEELDRVGAAMFDGKVPALWMAASYPSLKPLGPYVSDLCERVTMMSDWLAHRPPPVFWLGGFFFTHAFLTGVKQNFARRHKVPIDTVEWEFVCGSGSGDSGGGGDGGGEGGAAVVEAPADGAFVRGLFLEGARWDGAAGCLEESEPKVLFSHAPLMLLKPVSSALTGADVTASAAHARRHPHEYECPLYRTPERRGVLATTGHRCVALTCLEPHHTWLIPPLEKSHLEARRCDT